MTIQPQDHLELYGFNFKAIKRPILNAIELDQASQILEIPLPEMLFGNNLLELKYKDKVISFNAIDALKLVEKSDNGIKVSISKDWTRKSMQHHEEIKDVIKPYDWTYTSVYKGTTNLIFTPTTDKLNMELLTLPDPILFYQELVLYEDELGDNGTCILNVRLRVMPKCFLLLQRLFLRVDNVLFRVIDTRVYHEFNTCTIIRDFQDRMIKHQEMSQRIDFDSAKVGDVNWVLERMNSSHTLTHVVESASLEQH